MGFRTSLGSFARPKHSGGLAVAGLIVACGWSAPVQAADPLLKQLFDRQAAAAIEEAKSPRKALDPSVDGARFLMLATGRLLEGTVRPDPHGYRIETSDASQFFTFDQVTFSARDLREAYQKMCSANSGTPARRDLRLGRWCLENRLPHEAVYHLRKVLEGDPANQEAKSLLARLEAASTAGGFVRVGGIADQTAADAKLVESLARLSPPAVKEFVLGVQPILLARCGSTKCHGGPASTGFRLERVRLAAGGNRAATGRNLESVLSQVDPQFALRSPLLQKAAEAHGQASRAPLSGQVAAEQTARLSAWLQTVGPELNRLKQQDSSRRSVEKLAQAGKPQPHRDPLVVPASGSGIEPGPIRQDTARQDTGRQDAARLETVHPSSWPQGCTAPASQSQKPRTNSANDLGPLTDPFDPTQFNRGK
jgi:hypothetical protein